MFKYKLKAFRLYLKDNKSNNVFVLGKSCKDADNEMQRDRWLCGFKGGVTGIGVTFSFTELSHYNLFAIHCEKIQFGGKREEKKVRK